MTCFFIWWNMIQNDRNWYRCCIILLSFLDLWGLHGSPTCLLWASGIAAPTMGIRRPKLRITFFSPHRLAPSIILFQRNLLILIWRQHKNQINHVNLYIIYIIYILYILYILYIPEHDFSIKVQRVRWSKRRHWWRERCQLRTPDPAGWHGWRHDMKNISW